MKGKVLPSPRICAEGTDWILKEIWKIKNFKYPIKSSFFHASKNKGFDESKRGYWFNK